MLYLVEQPPYCDLLRLSPWLVVPPFWGAEVQGDNLSCNVMYRHAKKANFVQGKKILLVLFLLHFSDVRGEKILLGQPAQVCLSFVITTTSHWQFLSIFVSVSVRTEKLWMSAVFSSARSDLVLQTGVC